MEQQPWDERRIARERQRADAGSAIETGPAGCGENARRRLLDGADDPHPRVGASGSPSAPGAAKSMKRPQIDLSSPWLSTSSSQNVTESVDEEVRVRPAAADILDHGDNQDARIVVMVFLECIFVPVRPLRSLQACQPVSIGLQSPRHWPVRSPVHA